MEEKTKKIVFKTLKISSYVLLGILVFTLIFALIANIFAGKDKKISFFGLKSYIVLSDSMSATDFSAGDLIVSKSINTDDMTAQERNDYIEEKGYDFTEEQLDNIRRAAVLALEQTEAIVNDAMQQIDEAAKSENK